MLRTMFDVAILERFFMVYMMKLRIFNRIFQQLSQKSTFHAKMQHICVTGHPSWTNSFHGILSIQ